MTIDVQELQRMMHVGDIAYSREAESPTRMKAIEASSERCDKLGGNSDHK